MGFFKKLFSPKNETIIVAISEEISYTSPTYIYKTAKEKSNELISEDQQVWIDRYDKKACPNCGSVLVETPKSDRKCTSCGEKILVRSHFQKKDKKVLLKVDEKDLFEVAKKQYFDERWCVRELSFIEVSENQYLQKKKELGPAFSSFDVMKVITDRAMKSPESFHSVDAYFFYERCRLTLYWKNFERRGFTEDAYYVLLSIILWDGITAVRRKDKFEIAPGLIESLKSFMDKLSISKERLIKDFKENNSTNFKRMKNDDSSMLIEVLEKSI